MYFEITNNEITKTIPKAGAYNGTRFGVNATDDHYKEKGLYVLTEIKPTLLNYQEYDGHTDIINAETQTVTRTYSVIDQDIAKVAARIKGEITEYSMRLELGGVDIPGIGRINTNETAQRRAVGASQHADRNPSRIFSVSTQDGWVTVNKAQLNKVVDALAEHIATVSDNHKTHDEAIDTLLLAGDINSIANYDVTVGW